MKFHNILATIGNTPHVRINNLFGTDNEVYIKLEKQNLIAFNAWIQTYYYDVNDAKIVDIVDDRRLWAPKTNIGIKEQKFS